MVFIDSLPSAGSGPSGPLKLSYLCTSRTGGQPSRRRRLGWRKGSLHGSTGWRQAECCSLHRGDADSSELGGPLACSLIRANLNWRAGLSACHRLVTGAVATRRLAPRCVLPWEYEAPDSRRSEFRDSCVAALGCPCEPGQLCCCTSTCGVDSDVVAPAGM